MFKRNKAASRLKFNRHCQTAETLPALTSDYTTACHRNVTELGYSDNYNRSDKATCA